MTTRTRTRGGGGGGGGGGAPEMCRLPSRDVRDVVIFSQRLLHVCRSWWDPNDPKGSQRIPKNGQGWQMTQNVLDLNELALS